MSTATTALSLGLRRRGPPGGSRTDRVLPEPHVCGGRARAAGGKLAHQPRGRGAKV